MKKIEKPFFPHLDAPRFLAFLAVYVEHFSLAGFSFAGGETFKQFQESFFYRGYLGVSLFFVISGFLITVLLIHEWKNHGNINVKNFYIRRALRIWPLYFAVLLIGFILMPLINPVYAQDTARPWYYLLFAANFNTVNWGLPANPVLIPMWSLSVEEQFYLLFPLLLFFFRGRYLLLVLGLMIAGGLYYRWLLYPNFLSMGVHSLTVAPDIIVGVLCGLVWHSHPGLIERIEKLKSWQILLVYLLGIYLLFNGKFDYLLPTALFSRLVYTLFFGFIVLEQCFATNSIIKFSRIPFFSGLGIISYGLYCLHQPALLIGRWLDGISAPLLPAWLNAILIFVFSLLTAIGLAKISFVLLEKPFLKLKSKF